MVFYVFLELFSIKFLIKICSDLHRFMLSSILHSKIEFLEWISKSKILNRFNQDILTVDTNLSESLKNISLNTFEILGIFVLLSIFMPLTLIVIAFVLVMFVIMIVKSYFYFCFKIIFLRYSFKFLILEISL